MPTLLIEGDSIHASGLDVSAGSLRHRYISSAIPLRYGAFFDGYANVAVGGSELADAVGRADAAIAANSPDWVHIHSGTNDLPSTSLVDMKTAAMDLASRYKVSGAGVVQNTVLARGAITDEQEAKRQAFNDVLREMAEPQAGFIDKLIDFDKLDFDLNDFDPLTDFDPAVQTNDELHPNVSACFKIFKFVGDQCADVFTNPTPGANLFSNPNLWGVDGSDRIPADATIGAVPAGVTVTPVKDETTDFRQGFRVSGTNSGTGTVCIITLGAGISVSPGESRYASALIEAQGLSGIVGTSLSIRYDTSPLTYNRTLGNAGSSTSRELVPDHSGTYYTMRNAVPASASSASMRAEIYFRDGVDISGLLIVDDVFFGGVA